VPSDATLARRAVAVCGWLQADNEYGRAAKVARRTLARIDSATGQKPVAAADVERVYWEAILAGRMLDRLSTAIDLLDSALKVAPNDDRLLDLKLQFCATAAARVH
jgi:hypothetical protein